MSLIVGRMLMSSTHLVNFRHSISNSFQSSSAKSGAQGFTIIEVLVVLAIAGLIILIILLAVPALQRAQRNNARKSDAGRIAAAVQDFYANNGSQLPTYSLADATTVNNSLGKLGGFGDLTPISGGVVSNQQIGIAAVPSQAALATTLINAVRIVPNSDCVNPGASTTATGTIVGKSFAIQYTIETGTNGVSAPVCLDGA